MFHLLSRTRYNPIGRRRGFRPHHVFLVNENCKPCDEASQYLNAEKEICASSTRRHIISIAPEGGGGNLRRSILDDAHSFLCRPTKESNDDYSDVIR